MYIIFMSVIDTLVKETVSPLGHYRKTLAIGIISLSIGSINTENSSPHLSAKTKRHRQMVTREVTYIYSRQCILSRLPCLTL
jgi:hypothetical protein